MTTIAWSVFGLAVGAAIALVLAGLVVDKLEDWRAPDEDEE